jgi:hypothetical protein
MRRHASSHRAGAGIVVISALCAAPLFGQPDLIVDQDQLANSWSIEDREFQDGSCALVEACIGGSGVRRLLKFDALIANIAQVDFVLGDPTTDPRFIFSPCHGHYHFEGFTEYRVLDALGHQVMTGRKQAFCVLDTLAYLSEPWVPQRRLYTCEFQGLQPGWGDIYGANLDCQWIDVTNLPGGDYTLGVTVNPEGSLTESDYANNTVAVPVTLDAPAGLPHRPDGRRVPGSPLLVNPEGADLRVDYDVSFCPPPDYNLYYGFGSGTFSYAYSGAVCGVGTSGSALVSLPDPAPGQMVWFLIVGVDPFSSPVREGGHGFDSDGTERPLRGTGFCSVGRTQPSISCS